MADLSIQPTKPAMTSAGNASDDIVWRPTPEFVQQSRIQHFMTRHNIGSFDELVRRSNADIAWFWDAVSKDLDLEWYRPYDKVVDVSAGIPWAKWWTGGLFNYVHNAVDKHVTTNRRNKLAIIWEGEDGAIRKLSYWDVYVETNRLANALRAMGIGKGDCVGIFMPMVPETAIATFAISKLGAIYVPIFSGYGPQAVADRLKDCDAKLLITADGFYRRGGIVPMKDTADAAMALSPSVKHLLVFKRMGQQVAWTQGRDIWWHEAVAGQSRECATEHTDPEDPMLLIYTSGTTGKPKGTVHPHGGFPIKASQDLAHCFDLGEKDVIFWITDIGWMMGPWLIAGAHMLGSTAVYYEGTPDHPHPDRVWDIVERHGVTVLGISPTAIRAMMPHGEEWVNKHDMSTLRVMGGTGEPWNPDPYMWYFNKVGGGRCPIINYSGGTECAGGLVGCFPITPLKVCSFAGPIPGIDADVLDEHGKPVRGAVGELVVRQPWPGMTRGFWKDPERYLETYWSRWPNIWVHGDWAIVDDDGFWFITGRSDDTIKIAGKRVGPAEVESAAVAHPAVAEAAAVGVPDELKGEVVIVFVILAPGHTASDALRDSIKEAVVDQLGKTLRPKDVKFVRELPKTRNAKIMRRVIKARYLGKTELGDISSLDNPSAIEEIGRAI